jgi:cytochrome c biogenesis protein CcdA
MYNGVQLEETTIEKKGSFLMILVPNALFVVTFAVLAVMSVLMLRRGVVAGAVCAAIAAVGCALPLVAIGLAPAAREGSMVAAAVVVAAYILAYVFMFGGAAGMFVFSRARVQSALDDVAGEGK